ncbi:hypothetical protein [Streptococcus sanguinis]|uniref:hypothetical protein n=1 Tax=Streptococcus sanguinis TaxID=1305 RepID=UPI000F68F731|nr:hypothetical protein [Streptococcus sanguinis]RSI35905.1 hypothetical protein D8876_04265 [Streptococcus sanguinis]
MNNSQRNERLIEVTNNESLSRKIVAESNERELDVLDMALQEPENKLLFIGSTDYYSICRINKESQASSKVIVLDYISGMSPMNWGEKLYKEAVQKYGLDAYSLYMRNTLAGRDEVLPLDF